MAIVLCIFRQQLRRGSVVHSSSFPRLSLSLYPSFSLFLYLFLSLKLSISLFAQVKAPHEHGDSAKSSPHPPVEMDRKEPRRGGSAPLTVKWRRWPWLRHVVKPRLVTAVPLPPATVDGNSGLEKVHFASFIVLVLSVRDKSGWIAKHAFRDELSKL